MGVAALQVTEKSQVAALARMFSASVVQELAQSAHSPMLSRLIDESGIRQSVDANATLHEVFDTAFDVLKQIDHRHEYVYKSAITNKILLGRHSLRTAAMVTEFRVGSCKADVVILNGTSTAYEIKSERDRLDRLPTQIDAYRNVFANVCLVVGANHVDTVIRSVPEDVGIVQLSDRYQLSNIREPTDRTGIVDPVAILESLRIREAVGILERLKIGVPDVPNTMLYGELRQIYRSLPPEKVHGAMVKELKTSRSLERWSVSRSEIPESLTAAVFSTKIRKADYPQLLSSFNTTLTSL